MYSVGVFYAWDFLFIMVMAMAYFLCPKTFIEKKLEYIKFGLTFLSIFFLLFIIITNVLCSDGMTHMLFWISILPALFLFHLVYPFKEVKRNQHLNFFLFFSSLYVVGVNALIILAFSLSNM